MNPKTKMSTRTIGYSAIGPFAAQISGSRAFMEFGASTQAMHLINGEEPLCNTGLYKELGKTAFLKQFKNDSLILNVFKEDNKEIIIYSDLEDNQIKIMVIEDYKITSKPFGFRYKRTPEYDLIYRGAEIPAGTIVATPLTVHNNGGYSLGANLKALLCTYTELSNDAAIISKSAAKKLTSLLYDRVKLIGRSNEIPLNLYGTETEYKSLPEVGDIVRDDGLLFATRELNPNTPMLFSNVGLMEVDNRFDACVYSRPGYKVVGIKVILQKRDYTRYGASMEQIEELAKRDKTDEIYASVIHESKSNIMTIDRETKGDLAHAKALVNGKILVNRTRLENYYIEVELEKEYVPGIGSKVTGTSGDKGIISGVFEDEDMPNGCDIMMEADSTVSRMNNGRLFDQFFGSVSDEIRKYVLANWETNPDLAMEYILRFLEVTDNEQYIAYKNATNEERNEILKDVVLNGFMIYIPVDNKVSAKDVIFRLLEKEFKYNMDHVKVKTPYGEVTTISKAMVAPMHFKLLGKLPDSWLSCTVAYTNHYGVPIGLSGTGKARLPYSHKPVKILGETETRMLSAVLDPEALAELRNRAVSEYSAAEIYEAYLSSKHPSNIDSIFDMENRVYGRDVPLELFDSILAVAGRETFFIEDSDEAVFEGE